MAIEIKEQFATNVYYDRTFDCDAAKILPGEYYYTPKDMLIVTVLGSCVSACIRDRVSGLGGMNHFMLPDGGGDANSPASASARYGSYAMEILINDQLKSGARRENMEAKVFGGGNVLPGLKVNNVGQRNVEFVLDYLHNEGIPIIAQDLLDEFPRKVYFFPDTGKVMVRKIKSVHNSTIIDRESEYRMRVKYAPKSGEVDLF